MRGWLKSLGGGGHWRDWGALPPPSPVDEVLHGDDQSYPSFAWKKKNVVSTKANDMGREAGRVNNGWLQSFQACNRHVCIIITSQHQILIPSGAVIKVL